MNVSSPFDPRALEESKLPPIPSLMAKDIVGTNRDEIGEEPQKLCPILQLGLVSKAIGMTVHGRTAHRLLFCSLHKVFNNLVTIPHTNYDFCVIGLIGIV